MCENYSNVSGGVLELSTIGDYWLVVGSRSDFTAYYIFFEPQRHKDHEDDTKKILFGSRRVEGERGTRRFCGHLLRSFRWIE